MSFRVVTMVLAALALAGCFDDTSRPAGSVEILAYGVLEHERVTMRPDETSGVGANRADAQGLRIAAQTDR